MPGKSALTVTPCTAATEPIAPSAVGQLSTWATIVLTASGGGCQAAPAAMAALIWKNFTVPMPPTRTNRTARVFNIRLFMDCLLIESVPRDRSRVAE